MPSILYVLKWHLRNKNPFVTLNCGISWFLNHISIFSVFRKEIRGSSATKKIMRIVYPNLFILIIKESRDNAIQSDKRIYFESDAFTFGTPKIQLILKIFPRTYFMWKDLSYQKLQLLFKIYYHYKIIIILFLLLLIYYIIIIFIYIVILLLLFYYFFIIIFNYYSSYIIFWLISFSNVNSYYIPGVCRS